MVLSKRKRDGGIVAGQTPTPSAPSAASELPPAKKTLTKSSNTFSSTSSLNLSDALLQPRAAMLPEVSHVPSTTPPDIMGPGPSRPRKTARPRKRARHDAPKPEKRRAIFKKSCPQNILDRVGRVMSQRFFMIDRQREPGELRETFSVLGSTGNVYTVNIDHKPCCNCPDAMKGNHCKHILFVFLKVLQVAQESGLWYQKALLTTELEKIFAEAPLAPNALANPRIREAHARATGKATTTTPDAMSSSKKRIPGSDDDCPICYEGMYNVNETLLTFCEKCGNALHKQCFEQWKISSVNGGKQLSCVFCRARWVTPNVGSGGAGRFSREGYINLADVSGISPIRDTSTYYHGRRRGERHYGY